MKKLLFAFFVLAVVMGSTPLHAQHFTMTDDDEREIPLFPAGSKEGGPVARNIIIQPASTYINNDMVTVVFNCDTPKASITITDASGVNVYSGASIHPTLITIDLNATEPGEYYLVIELGEARLSGNFTL
ncbi:DUF3244 domain-containing protein [Bacteroides timonensis]|uniref:DUF3244 domain-containing protein n=1 Tax=Bacteroides timonensis TaxID=1470345 RepID=UPI0004B955BF|nr:DUF3244 domain-containing protein [Bacteroides timonensis]